MTELSCDAPCTRVYIEASYANPFRSGWGAVVVHPDGRTQELSESTEGETQPRSLLMGCLHVLMSIPQDVPVRFYSVHEFFVRWTIPRLSAMLADDFRTARKNKNKNLDLVEQIAVKAQSFLSVEAIPVDKLNCNNDFAKAESLALEYGTGGGGFTVGPAMKVKPKLKTKPTSKSRPKLEAVASPSDESTTFQPDDLPFDL